MDNINLIATDSMEEFIGKERVINPFKQNEISHSYQLDQSISVLRDVELYFYSNSNRIFCKQTAETLIICHILRRLI